MAQEIPPNGGESEREMTDKEFQEKFKKIRRRWETSGWDGVTQLTEVNQAFEFLLCHCEELYKERERLQAQLTEYRVALEFYANMRNWIALGDLGFCTREKHEGEKAREVLAKWKGKK